MRVHLFLPDLQFKLERSPGKITAFGEGDITMVPSAPDPCRTGAVPNQFIQRLGGVMKARFIGSALLWAGIFIFLSLAACTPKSIINGRVVDAETKHPIKGAVVAIRWYGGQPAADSETSRTFGSSEDITDADGRFEVPGHPDKDFAIGVYKEGYICWSNRSRFTKGKKAAAAAPQQLRVEDGMQVRLEPLKATHSHDQHAGFAVLVAEDVTESKKSPFYKAIKPLFRRWRDNLRKQFQKAFERQPDVSPH